MTSQISLGNVKHGLLYCLLDFLQMTHWGGLFVVDSCCLLLAQQDQHWPQSRSPHQIQTFSTKVLISTEVRIYKYSSSFMIDNILCMSDHSVKPLAVVGGRKSGWIIMKALFKQTYKGHFGGIGNTYAGEKILIWIISLKKKSSTVFFCNTIKFYS